MILDDIEKFLARKSMGAAQFGEDVMNDRAFVFQLRQGRQPRPLAQAKIYAYIKEKTSA